MQKTSLISCSFLFLLIAACIGIAGAYETPESIVAAGKVYISNVTIDPGTFFTDDTGTITFEVANGASEQGIVVNHAILSGDGNFRTTSESYHTSSNIGPALSSSTGTVTIPQTRTFNFAVIADGSDGTYYPTFSLSFRDSDSLYYRALVKVDNTPLILTVKDKPNAYSAGKKKTVYLEVANPRDNQVDNVILKLSSDGADFTPSQVYVGNLNPHQTVPVNFSITPSKEAPIQLTLDYDNGDNPHTVAMELPVVFGTDKKAAEPVMSNVQVTNTGGTWHVTGDVNNAGLETANTVIVTSLPPAVPEDPYKVYVVGALKPDDFGSFEVTFAAEDTETVPLKLSYKDDDGNVYDSVQDVKISASGISDQTGSSGFPVVPVAAGIIVLLVFIGGWAYYLRRNKK